MKTEITVREALALTRYVRQQIYNLVADGRVQARKEGHELRLDRSALLAYAKQHKKLA